MQSTDIPTTELLQVQTRTLATLSKKGAKCYTSLYSGILTIIVKNLPPSLRVNEFCKLVSIWQSYKTDDSIVKFLDTEWQTTRFLHHTEQYQIIVCQQ